MSKVVWYIVIEEYDQKKHGSFPPRVMKTLSLLKKGLKFRPVTFAKENCNILVKNVVKSKDPETTAISLMCKTLKIAKKYNLVTISESNKDNLKKFTENNQTIKDWFETLSKTNFQNIKSVQTSTATTFRGKLNAFDKWVIGRSITYKDPWIPRETHEEVKECTITFTGVESMCNHLKKNRHLIADDFIILVEQFLNSSIHDGLKDVSKLQFKSAINSYFKFHRTKIHTDWKPSKNRTGKINKRSKKNKRSLSLEEIGSMIILGSPSPRDLAVLMIMFHRGLDKSTMCDRFNFQAWEQIVEWFGTEDWNKWDLAKCPVPIELERVKTDVESYGFLEKDAILCLQTYLDDRYESTGTTPQIEEPLILNQDENPLQPEFPYRMIRRLANKSKKQQKLTGRTSRNNCTWNKISVHLLRHTLETIIENNVKGKSLSDSAINHAGTYNDSAEITPEILREQYSTLAPLINIYSKIKNNLNGDDPERISLELENQKLRNEITSSRKITTDDSNMANHIMEEYVEQNKILQSENKELKRDVVNLKEKLNKILESISVVS